jgi:hypothetical protein
MDKEKYPFAGSKFSVNLAELMEKGGVRTQITQRKIERCPAEFREIVGR